MRENIEALDQDFAQRMYELRECGDKKSRHARAEELLCEILKVLGFVATIKEINELEK